MPTELQKLQKELKEATDRYEIWCDAILTKQILKRNTEEEIKELDKDFKKQVIMPIIEKIVWLKIQQGDISDDDENPFDYKEDNNEDPYADEKAYDEYKNK